jgi:uncharacterized protein (TIGR04255 family)
MEQQIPKEVVKLLEGSPQELLPAGLGEPNHRFIAADSNTSISLTKDFIAIVQSRYTCWEDFRKEIIKAKTAFEHVYKPAFYARIGLRYRNEINKKAIGLDDIGWSELIRTDLCGPLADQNIRNDIHRVWTQMISSLDEVAGAYYQLQYGIKQHSESDDPVFIIDADFFTQERLNNEDIAHALDEFNRLDGDLFRWAITQRLHEALGRRDTG